MITWFKLLSKPTKMVVILALLFLVVCVYLLGNTLCWKYKYFKNVEAAYNELKIEVQNREANEIKIIDAGIKTNKSYRQQGLNIDEKLKQDEKSIDNNNITNDELREFIAKHEK